MSEHFTAIRVPLREVNADADIVTQIEDTIRRITRVGFDSWIKLSALFKNCPPLVILDGYDELLQASGQVFASYIKDAQRFQERESEQGRPLRVIITSRVTLIDKAATPAGATIVRLLEFDQQQRECWAGIWNTANAAYFRDAGIEKFALPSEKERGAEKILNLAEQPLLLLMLALYDSQANQLRDSKGLDRTKLYDSLLRRFVIRERGKEKGFNDAKAKERDKALSTEMQRLGVAALGMYNRRKVHILSSELDDDLSFFKLEREATTRPGKALSQADLLLGSFFFVHKSKAKHSSGAEDTHEETAAFEFLHNTFGEFLTADFVLRRAVAQVQALRAAESTEALRPLLDKMMGTADGFERDWFASLVYTPLFTRPVIMEMIREWTPHVLKDNGLSEEDFVDTLEKIVLNQIKRLLNKREMPQIMRKETAQEGYRVPFGDHPLVGHIAIYSINLILLRLIAGKRPFVFDESAITSYEDGTRPWDRVIYVWRSWFGLGNLNGLTAIMLAERMDSKVTIRAKSKFQAVESKSKFRELHNVALSLGDSISAGITGLYLFDPIRDSEEELSNIERCLSSEGFDLRVPLIIARLLVIGQRLPEFSDEFIKYGVRAMEQALEAGRKDQLENICFILVRALQDQMYVATWQLRNRGVFRELFHPRFIIQIAVREPISARIIFDLAKRLRDFEWLDEFSGRLFEFATHEMPRYILDGNPLPLANWVQLLREVGKAQRSFPSLMRHGRSPNDFFDRMLDPRFLLELSERDPQATLVYLQTLKELGGRRYFERLLHEMRPEYFERMFHPRRLLEISERNPETALGYLQIMQEVDDGRFLRYSMEREMGTKFLAQMFHPRQLLGISERDPEAALAYLQMLRELDGDRYIRRFIENEMGAEFFERMLLPRDLLEITSHNPKVALRYVQILKELGGDKYIPRFVERNLGPEFFERIFDPGYLSELSQYNSEAALAYLQVSRELGGDKYIRRFIERDIRSDFFDRMFGMPHLFESSERRVSELSVWLNCARLFNSKRFNQLITGAISENLHNGTNIRHLLLGLPIKSLADLKWLAEQVQAPELHSLVSQLST